MESEPLIKHAPTDHRSKEAKVALHKTRGFAWFPEAAEVDYLDGCKENGDDNPIENEEKDAQVGKFEEKRNGGAEERKGKEEVEYVDEKAGELLPFRIIGRVWVVGHGGMLIGCWRTVEWEVSLEEVSIAYNIHLVSLIPILATTKPRIIDGN